MYVYLVVVISAYQSTLPHEVQGGTRNLCIPTLCGEHIPYRLQYRGGWVSIRTLQYGDCTDYSTEVVG